MSQNINNGAQNSSDKSQWNSPEVWDLSVGRTQGGPVLFDTEGVPVTAGDIVLSTTGTPDEGGGAIDLGAAS